MKAIDGKLYRHGDVLIAGITEFPRTALHKDGTVLAHGELTGHSHKIEDPSTAQLFEDGGMLYVEVTGRFARLTHEEHRTILLPPGRYRVWVQREYAPPGVLPVRD